MTHFIDYILATRKCANFVNFLPLTVILDLSYAIKKIISCVIVFEWKKYRNALKQLYK